MEGAFGRAFRSGLQPVEIGRRLIRELDAGRVLGVRGTVAPNHFTVSVSPDDADQLGTMADALVRELAEAARAHAHEEGYRFLGPVTVELLADPRLHRGALDVEAAVVEGPGGRVGAVVLPDGRRHELGEDHVTIGRLPDCTVTLPDAQVSRHHAEIRPDGDGFVVADLGSTNGTRVNGARVREHHLVDGDEIVVGSTVLRFEAS